MKKQQVVFEGIELGRGSTARLKMEINQNVEEKK